MCVLLVLFLFCVCFVSALSVCLCFVSCELMSHMESCFFPSMVVVFNTLHVHHSPQGVPLCMKMLDWSLAGNIQLYFILTFYTFTFHLQHIFIYLVHSSNDLYIFVFWSQFKQARPIHSTNNFTSLNVE